MDKRINNLVRELNLDEKDPVSIFMSQPVLGRFKVIPARMQTPELVDFALSKDIKCFKHVAKALRTRDRCIQAVSQNGLLLTEVPSKLRDAEMCHIAVENDGGALEFVPSALITQQLVNIALQSPAKRGCPMRCIPRELLSKDIIKKMVMANPNRISCVPEEYLTRDLCLLSVSTKGTAISEIPYRYLDKELIQTAVFTTPSAIGNIPEYKRTKKLCEYAFSHSPLLIKYIPEKWVTKDMCLSVLEQYSPEEISTSCFPYKFLIDGDFVDIVASNLGVDFVIKWNNSLLCQTDEVKRQYTMLDDEKIRDLKIKFGYECVEMVATKVQLPFAPTNMEIVREVEQSITHVIDEGENGIKKIYYISDIHLEHQFDKRNGEKRLFKNEVSAFLDEKIEELLSNTENKYDSILLIGGDIADSVELEKQFFERLSKKWKGKVLFTLGNHELWDNCFDMDNQAQSVDVIIDKYREAVCSFDRFFLLQNDVYVQYKNSQDVIISEKQILQASRDDLREICTQSTTIILGGIGFSGCEGKYNATSGIYRKTLTTLEEDALQSRRFAAVYDKIASCIGDKCVIVLTHMPMDNWSRETYNPHWIYISGHTHQNTLIRKEDGTTVLSDNQIGYLPRKWKLNCFQKMGWYDYFETMEDGIHEISAQDYEDFNSARGIVSWGCNRSGSIFALKRNGKYLFLFQTKNGLSILGGGKLNKLGNKNIQYYYDNLNAYFQKVEQLLMPYYNALKMISKEVISFGGQGTIHGCIVDIGTLTHLYLDPITGELTPYFAFSIGGREKFKNIFSLLHECEPQYCAKYLEMSRKEMLPLLGEENVSCPKFLVTTPEVLIGTEMYKPSNFLRALQYAIEQDVIRVWDEKILSFEPNQTTEDLKLLN